jgi:hypothetical protein
MPQSFEHDPNAKGPFFIDWGDDGEWLGYEIPEKISASSWSVAPTGLVIESSSFSDYVSMVVVSGGVLGTTYLLTNLITTDVSGYQEPRTIEIKCEAK